MRYDVTFILTALVCLLTGEILGAYMGVAQNFAFTPVHAHLNLVGWVSLALYGLVHRAYPALASAKLAFTQWLLAMIGGLGLPLGLALMVLGIDTMVVKLAAVVVILATFLFVTMFFGKAVAVKPA